LLTVVIDHEAVPHGTIPVSDSELTGAVVLLRKDWEFPFDQLKSTHAVAGYLDRVSGDAQELGLEPSRYHELAAEDAVARPAPIPSRLQDLGGRQVSEPLLPLAPAAHDDLGPHSLFRAVLEDVALGSLGGAEDRGLRVLAELDSLPIVQRAAIGTLLGEYLDTCTRGPGGRHPLAFASSGYLRRVTQPGFGGCSRLDAAVHAAFEAWVRLRHHEFLTTLPAGSAEPVTVAALLTPRSDGRRPWDTTLCAVAGWQRLSPAELDACTAVWSNSKTASADTMAA
jgi:hypothetical protein